MARRQRRVLEPSAVAAMLLFSWLAGGCETVGQLSPGQEGPSIGRLCAGPDAPDGCGRACTADSLCAAGLHCADGQCTAECGARLACDDGLVCDDRGRCEPPMADAGPVPDGGGVDAGDDCAAVTVELDPVIPNVLFIVDRSGSMLDPFRGGDTDRWDTLFDGFFRGPGTDGAGDPGGIIRQLDGVVPFGVTLYTYRQQLPANQCPVLLDVEIGLGNADDLEALFEDNPPPGNGDTPTGDSITQIHEALPRDELEGPVVFVVATDGAPDRCEDPNGHDEVSRRLSIDAVQAAHADGIDTFMISLANVGQRHMQDMANAGIGLPVPDDEDTPYPDGAELATFYDPQSTEDLATALTEIIETVQSCELEVDGELIVDRACDGTLLVDGVETPCDDPGGGWRATDATHIELLGDLCEDLKAGRVRSIEGRFPCDSVILR